MLRHLSKSKAREYSIGYSCELGMELGHPDMSDIRFSLDHDKAQGLSSLVYTPSSVTSRKHTTFARTPSSLLPSVLSGRPRSTGL